MCTQIWLVLIKLLYYILYFNLAHSIGTMKMLENIRRFQICIIKGKSTERVNGKSMSIQCNILN